MIASLQGYEPGSRATSTEEATSDREELLRAVVNRRVCELTRVL
jgi:hypothetical protein